MNPAAELCNAGYTRPPQLAAPGAQVLHCQYVRGHPIARHSWFAIQAEDEAQVRAQVSPVDTTPESLQRWLDLVAAGHYDKYLEAILAVAHNRKRARRGTAGFQ